MRGSCAKLAHNSRQQQQCAISPSPQLEASSICVRPRFSLLQKKPEKEKGEPRKNTDGSQNDQAFSGNQHSAAFLIRSFVQANTMTAKDCHRTTALVVLVKYHDYPPVQLGNLQRGKRFRVCLVPPKTPTKTSLSITSPSHPHHIETLNVANNPCMEY